MNTHIILVIVLYGYVFAYRRIISAQFTALSDSPYILRLYYRVRNLDPPSTSDPATFDARIRRQICAEIFDSEWFRFSNGFLLDPDYVNLNHGLYEYARVYSLLFSLSTRQYENGYLCRHLPFNGSRFREYSFLCPVRYANSFFGIVMYAVTKEYDVSAVGQPYKPGRFVTPFRRLATGLTFQTILAEEPARVDIRSSVDVERYYKHVRNYIEPASGNDIDPLCKLIFDDDSDKNNQHFRFCAAVTRSTDLRNMGYPVRNQANFCSLKEVSFRRNEDEVTSDEASAAGKRYHERMTRCYVRDSSGNETFLYISRAYRSNQLFVYSPDDADEDDKIYLVNLSSNVSIVDELNSFDFFEW